MASQPLQRRRMLRGLPQIARATSHRIMNQTLHLTDDWSQLAHWITKRRFLINAHTEYTAAEKLAGGIERELSQQIVP